MLLRVASLALVCLAALSSAHPPAAEPTYLGARRARQADGRHIVDFADRVKRNQVTQKPRAFYALQGRNNGGGNDKGGKSVTPPPPPYCPNSGNGGGSCTVNGGGSDGCTPYTVKYTGVTLPSGKTFSANSDVNMKYTDCSAVQQGQSYRSSSGIWPIYSLSIHMEQGKASGKYIGTNSYDDWNLPVGYCVAWVQIGLGDGSGYNQHFGEGGQYPICNCSC